jgi:DNA-directed RNA polymerase specialized sigma24 family protein
VDWETYPYNIDQYRRKVLQEENNRRPKHELPYDPTLIAQLSSSAILRKELGRWRQPPSQHHYGPASGGLPNPLATILMCIRRSIRRLNVRQQVIVRLYYEAGWSQEQVAAHLRRSRRRVRQLIAQIATTIRQDVLKQQEIGHLLGQHPPARRGHYCRATRSADTRGNVGRR